MLILNTRPIERAQALSQDLKNLGYQVISCPLLELKPLPLDESLVQQYQQFISFEKVVVVSSIAAEIGMQYARQCHISIEELKQKQWIAVGTTTQSTLQKLGLESVCPEIENSEGMLQLKLLQDCQQHRIAFWRGIGGRTLMMTQLQQQGCQVLNMLLYTRNMPDIQWQNLLQQAFSRIIVLISSEASWKNWLKLRQNTLFLQQNFNNYHYVVLGQRVGQQVSQDLQQLAINTSVAIVEHLVAQEIHQKIQQMSL
ncbi:uroporphyrinogen-III synthase [Acinetobacter qingfengensis]|uniref:Uroporphyrinogen-III synthase n=1 Tax=Acinetobacter qingfengensis TaxID=1262585 RepID=A0A1E7RCX7_9GAMM|nr:uroporphyrinogen-III synthase [Acinetobacter qingfengensis]KAA8732351.1 uroporphyrinogen-III synthase [Acinetobacter qingfengensis]OEY97260.1 hypothetical protein BJI46_02235 [Acinetobacter qingfengensis]